MVKKLAPGDTPWKEEQDLNPEPELLAIDDKLF